MDTRIPDWAWLVFEVRDRFLAGPQGGISEVRATPFPGMGLPGIPDLIPRRDFADNFAYEE